MEIGCDKMTSATSYIVPDQWNLSQEPIDRMEWDEAEFHVERAVAQVDIAVGPKLEHRATQVQIIRMHGTIAALKIGRDAIKGNSSNARIRQMRRQPSLKVDQAQDTHQKSEAVDHTVSDLEAEAACQGLKEIHVGISPDIKIRMELTA